MADLSREIAARIRMIREQRGLTQQQVEQGAQIATGHLNRVESGARGRNISVDFLVKVADFFGLNLHWLITGRGPIWFAGYGMPGMPERALYDPRFGGHQMAYLPHVMPPAAAPPMGPAAAPFSGGAPKRRRNRKPKIQHVPLGQLGQPAPRAKPKGAPKKKR